MSVVSTSKKADLGDLSKTSNLTRAIRDSGNLGEYIEVEFVDAEGKTQTRRILDACGGAAVACFGNGGRQAEDEGEFKDLYKMIKRMYGDRDKYDNPYGKVMLAAMLQMIEIPYGMHYAYTTPVHSLLTERLRDNANAPVTEWENADEMMSNVMILNSGSEVCDAMVKLAWQYHNGLTTDTDTGARLKPAANLKEVVITRNTSYHGNTVQALSLSEFPTRKANFQGLFNEDNLRKVARYYPYRDMKKGWSQDDYDDKLIQGLVETIEHVQKKDKKGVAAFVIETVSGAALGCQMPSVRYLRKVKKVCRKYDILLVYDEIMCGLGRIGYANAWHYFDKQLREDGGDDVDYVSPGNPETRLPEIKNLAPDMMLIGKVLGAGIEPASGVVCSGKIVNKLQESNRKLTEFSHGHTFQAHSVVCAAALETQRLLPGFLTNIRKRGEQLGKGLKAIAESNPYIGDVRGNGCFWGVEFVRKKDEKEPFSPESNIANKFVKDAQFPEDLKAQGIDVYAGQWTEIPDANGFLQGDHVIIAPAFHATEALIVKILETFEAAVGRFFEKENLRKLEMV
ncbi:aminotransferase- variant [Apiospora saccharicola]|uniref:Aminotransferase- variant n=1 Tax=Apiospora saccharicola TaxID=335842 RepID=A0ABR1W4Y2_9PEZI